MGGSFAFLLFAFRKMIDFDVLNIFFSSHGIAFLPSFRFVSFMYIHAYVWKSASMKNVTYLCYYIVFNKEMLPRLP